jgi:hypothetical protein
MIRSGFSGSPEGRAVGIVSTLCVAPAVPVETMHDRIRNGAYISLDNTSPRGLGRRQSRGCRPSCDGYCCGEDSVKPSRALCDHHTCCGREQRSWTVIISSQASPKHLGRKFAFSKKGRHTKHRAARFIHGFEKPALGGFLAPGSKRQPRDAAAGNVWAYFNQSRNFSLG